jgi:hypothetical protein
MNSFEQAEITARYKRLFLKNADGKVVLMDLAAKNGVDKSTFDKDPALSSYMQGRRDAILDIYGILNQDVRLMLMENVIVEDI